MVRATRSFLCQRTGASRGLLDVFKFKKSFYLFLLAAYDAKLMSPAVRHEYLTRLLLQDSPPSRSRWKHWPFKKAGIPDIDVKSRAPGKEERAPCTSCARKQNVPHHCGIDNKTVVSAETWPKGLKSTPVSNSPISYRPMNGSGAPSSRLPLNRPAAASVRSLGQTSLSSGISGPLQILAAS